MTRVDCCIAGGGPAGMMLGFLLARAGVRVLVLEKHADFFRDFRGDTIHPSTLEVIHELGLLDEFLKRPHQEVLELRGWVGRWEVPMADFRHLPTRCKFLALMPQWDFLDFLRQQAVLCPTFQLRLQSEVTDLIVSEGRVQGVKARTAGDIQEIRADLVVGADGRHSVVREKAGLAIQNLGAPIDVLWMRLSRKPGDPGRTFGRFDRGHVLAMLNRETYWQLGYVIPKGGIEKVQTAGLPALRRSIAEIAPFLSDRVDELTRWEDVRLLTVLVDRLKQWFKPGVLCIGDAAHAMSPVGGVGINLAIQDAVAAANLLAEPLRAGRLTDNDLEKVQKRRNFPTRATQRLQLLVQDNVLGAALSGGGFKTLPWPLRLMQALPILRRLPARIVGVGFRPEHVQTRQANK
jgi:2-polyprenyl-6-methoxyphenol hydroxylase-like FAD-dependent oxidoreductase